ncbi:mandelate racemase/muconate lactonizing enzyme family protein [Desulfobacter curvatus]|uniref:mandelate racemase/muconate lactonizing enzyme family protein n=1 Tax=Desulfobacter curvatus TaxID=2290 RepID=UPI00035CCA23|nr:dipeptide epimerase [Desulfobacter curvatus]
MKIKKVTVFRENLELTRPYTIAYDTFTHVENLFVLLETDTGLVGIGAGSPAEDVTGESIDACEKALNEQACALFEGMDLADAVSRLKIMETKMAATPAAMAAMDIALHDLMGKALNRPLVEILGRVHTAMPTSITIGIKSLDEMLAEADEYTGRGFKILKVKTGMDVDQDIERVCRLKAYVNADVRIRVDANQGYDVEQYKKFLAGTKGTNLEFVEQPLHVNKTAAMADLSEDERNFSMADESLHKPADAYALIHPPLPFGLFNIKLMKCGGIAQGLEIARIARHCGIKLMWGCMDESRASIAAALHAAFASPATRYLDLDGSLDLAKDMVDQGFIIEDGVMRLTDRPGLGVRIL